MEKDANTPLLVALTGPESVGKSTLTQALAQHYNAPMHSEYAREYIAQLNRPYTQDDVVHIARHQLDTARESMQTNALMVLFDTDAVVSLVWLEVVFGSTPSWLTQALSELPMHHLLLRPDLPWQPDPLRENGAPEARQQLYKQYTQWIQRLGKPYAPVSGHGPARVQAAIAAIDAWRSA